MFVFIKKAFHIGSLFLSSLISTPPLSCISMNNQVCKVRPEIVNIKTNEPVFYPFSIKISKCSSSCNNINDPYAKVRVPDVVKDLNIKVFNPMSRTNETRHKKWHGKCKYKVWNISNCKCECDKSCDFGEYLDYENCKCRKILVDKLIEQCNENIEETSLVKINSINCESNSSILYIVIFSIFFKINIGTATYFVYCKYINHNKENVSVYDYVYERRN